MRETHRLGDIGGIPISIHIIYGCLIWFILSTEYQLNDSNHMIFSAGGIHSFISYMDASVDSIGIQVIIFDFGGWEGHDIDRDHVWSFFVLLMVHPNRSVVREHDFRTNLRRWVTPTTCSDFRRRELLTDSTYQLHVTHFVKLTGISRIHFEADFDTPQPEEGFCGKISSPSVVGSKNTFF